MLTRTGRSVLVVFLLAGLFMGFFEGGTKRAHSDWAAPFIGGIMAGHVVSNIAAQRRAQTEAMQSMAYGGGGRPYGPPGGPYGRPEPPPAYAPPAPPQLTPQQQLNQLDALAAGGYITPAEYKARREAILNAM